MGRILWRLIKSRDSLPYRSLHATTIHPLTFFCQTVIPISFYPVRQNARRRDYAVRDS
jgi:hypothetical protein